jgi:uncharacterized membrane protein YdjX (TVP38/TMEM64 family)
VAFVTKRIWMVSAALCAGAVLLFFFRTPLIHFIVDAYAVLQDKERSAAFLQGLGWVAPLGYMAVQFLQVVIAPVPGEATGFIGGYLFGTLGAFVYSTIALTLGSWINFLIGRYLGKHWIRHVIPANTLARMDFILKHQGAIVIFILFLLPGFPKDSLCLFLGLSALPVKVLVILSAIGRMPGTLMLSAQGASLFEGDYLLLGILMGLCLLLGILAWRYREALYRWIEKQEHIDK